MHRFLTLLILLRFIIPRASAHAPPSSSPKASTDLICHTAHASECYPKIFQPTEQFKTVHDDQELPPGLHVRLNLQTGVKEARLNVPEGDEDEHSAVAIVLDGESELDDEDTEPPRILIPDTASTLR